MTLKEFWDSKKKLVIHCKTLEEAIIFCKASDKLGKTWSSGASYLDQTHWDRHEFETCYDNEGTYSPKFWYQENGYEVLIFESIFESINFNYLLTTQTKYIAVKDNTVLTLGGFKRLNTDAQVKLYPAPSTAKADLEKTYGTYEGVKFVKVKVSIEEIEE